MSKRRFGTVAGGQFPQQFYSSIARALRESSEVVSDTGASTKGGNCSSGYAADGIR
jgi:hypothetical protein